jgi:hypothetical protein
MNNRFRPRRNRNRTIIAQSDMNGEKIGSDNWLFIVTNALSYFIEEGGQVRLIYDEVTHSIDVRLYGVGPADPRIHLGLAELLIPPAEEGGAGK